LFDVEGDPTPAGSPILRDAPAAAKDAPVVARLRAPGAVIVGRTHMSEFAFSGLGTNPHCPRLANPHDATRLPGGSSSGAAVSVVLGQAAMGLGSDTGGSVRIPASYCGLTGFKPTQRRITRASALPLAQSLDSVGPIARSVECCRVVDAILSDAPIDRHPAVGIETLRFAVPTDIVLDDLDNAVTSAFERSLATLEGAGTSIERIPFPELVRIREVRGTITSAEAHAFHTRTGLLKHRDRYDPNVLARIDVGATMAAADLSALLRLRKELIAAADARTAGFDAVVLPTTATVAPLFTDVATREDWARVNALSVRNASLFNFLDRCAVSIPMQRGGELPCGLMAVGETMGDARLFAIGETIERLVAP
jgi:aspartyl-tRNA(Asn)/glutamyl-tRNA(Gln) amidotransferase subunit A